MAAQLKPYPAYKDSGVPWLGKVPAHWEIRRVKSLSLVKRGASPRPIGDARYFDDSGTYAWVRIADVTASNHYLEKTTQRLSQLGQSLSVRLQPGALFLSIAGSVGKPIITNIQCCIHDGFVYFPQFRGNVEFLYRVFSCGAPFTRLGKLGTQLNLNTDTVGGIYLGWPPLPEQTAIVRFLDHTDRRIRRYIHTKEKLIALLEEQKQAIIHQAVTGQIDIRTGQPYPAYKPSDVEWLGDVPAHWGVRRTKSLFRLRTEKSGVAHGRELLSIYTHIGVRPRKDLDEKGNKASTTDDYWIVKRGDLIANKLLTWMGAIGVSHYDGVTSPAYDILMPIADLVSDYYHHLFRTRIYLQQFKQRSRGIMDMRLRLYFNQFGQITIPVPPVDEQRAIINFYDEATVDTDHVINQARRQIDLLHEYRTRLIADVVTGKLDVREVAAALPEVGPLAGEGPMDDGLDTDAPTEPVPRDAGVLPISQ